MPREILGAMMNGFIHYGKWVYPGPFQRGFWMDARWDSSDVLLEEIKLTRKKLKLVAKKLRVYSMRASGVNVTPGKV